MIEAKLERLAAAGISLLPVDGFDRHFIFERDGFVALVERRDDGFGNIGAAGLGTEHGFAAVQWRGAEAWFIARGGFEQRAAAGDIEKLRRFESDLREALA